MIFAMGSMLIEISKSSYKKKEFIHFFRHMIDNMDKDIQNPNKS